ncbi:MAG: hypothetical protein B7Y83_00330 [Flavobacteriales bacterium 32-34-25]|nr:MAG: hypothetical protein B7Y83_00330 [Flavobacteriales bacterium 32-34-25]
MSSLVPVKIFYAKGIRVAMKTKTFKEVVECLFGDSPFSKYEPLKMVFTSTGKVLFMDKNAFNSYLSGNISMQELVELTECDELYRNTQDVLGVEKGHLWKASLNVLTLISDDEFVETKLDLKVFEIVE